MKRLPEDFEEIELSMSNFDCSIDEDMEKSLKKRNVFGSHAGWNFYGKVWFKDGQFHEDVWVYGTCQETISADSLQELMKKVNDDYGWE